jgi:hypothetical protein
MAESKGEALMAAVEGYELFAAKHDSESPA